MRALIVDDSRATRSALRRILRGAGFETFEASHGKEGLDRLREVGPVDLALVDWHMPEMDGLDLVESIRQDERFDGVSLMMVTSASEAAYVGRALEAGANEYLMKPFSQDALIAKLDLLGIPHA